MSCGGSNLVICRCLRAKKLSGRSILNPSAHRHNRGFNNDQYQLGPRAASLCRYGFHYCIFSRTSLGQGVVFDRPTSGIVQEIGNIVPFDVTLGLTGVGGPMDPLPYQGWPKTQSSHLSNGHQEAEFLVPPSVTDVLGTVYKVKDVRQTVKFTNQPRLGADIGPDPIMSDLSIEAVFLNSSTGEYQLYNIFGVIAQMVGVGMEIRIPDLVAALDDGDTLFSVVNLATYLKSPPTVDVGDAYDVVDGVVAGLPGMEFSTTPFSYDPRTGLFSGTPYTGLALDPTLHGLTTVPEPATWVMLLIGLAGVGFMRHRPVQVRAAVT